MFPLQKPPWPCALTRLPPAPCSSRSAASGSLLEGKPLNSWQSWYGEATHSVVARDTCRLLFYNAEGLIHFLRVPETVENGGKSSVWKLCLAGRLCIHAIRVPQSPCPPPEASCGWCRTKSEQMTVLVLQILYVIGDNCISRDALDSYRSKQPLEYSQCVLSGAPQHSPRAPLRSALSIQIMISTSHSCLQLFAPGREQHAMGYHGSRCLFWILHQRQRSRFLPVKQW